MIGTKRRFGNCDGTLEQRLGLRIATHGAVEGAEAVQ
jgi:hypothetical protein